MRKTATLLLLTTVALTGCAAVNESRFNPLNWFGRGQPDAAATDVATAERNPLIPERRASVFFDNEPEAFAGRPIADVTELFIERRPGGAIIRATGEADRVGPYDVRLIRDDAASDDQTLVFDLKGLQSPGPRSTGPRARQVTVAVFISTQDLEGIRAITVRGANTSRTSRR